MSPTCRALSFRERKLLLSGVWPPGNKACCGCCGVSDCPVLTQGPSVQEPERRDESEGWSLSQPGQPVGGGTTAPALDGKALVSCPLPPPSTATARPVRIVLRPHPLDSSLVWASVILPNPRMINYQQEPEHPHPLSSWQLGRDLLLFLRP